jgi:hypothetical protein
MPMLICTTCGSTFKRAEQHTKGSFIMEVALWLFFLLPGLIYSIWRLTSRYYACPACGSCDYVPTDTPLGRRLLETSQMQPRIP